MERTLSIIKPDAVAKNVIGEIYSRFENAGFKIVAAKMIHLDEIKSEVSLSNEMVSVLNFLKIFNSMHLVGMNKVRSLNLIEKILL